MTITNTLARSASCTKCVEVLKELISGLQEDNDNHNNKNIDHKNKNSNSNSSSSVSELPPLTLLKAIARSSYQQRHEYDQWGQPKATVSSLSSRHHRRRHRRHSDHDHDHVYNQNHDTDTDTDTDTDNDHQLQKAFQREEESSPLNNLGQVKVPPIKCLHAHYAHYRSTCTVVITDDNESDYSETSRTKTAVAAAVVVTHTANPVGEMIHKQLKKDFSGLDL